MRCKWWQINHIDLKRIATCRHLSEAILRTCYLTSTDSICKRRYGHLIDREDFTWLKKDRKSEGLLDSRVCGLCIVFIVAELSTNSERVSAD